MKPSELFHTIEIEINRNCNQSCKYCPNSIDKSKIIIQDGYDQEVMEIEKFKKILNDLKSIDYKGSIHYHFYGEPFLCKNIDEFIELTHQTLSETTKRIYTNGSLFVYSNNATKNKEILEKINSLFKKGLSELIVTTHEELKFFEVLGFGLSDEIKNKIIFRNNAEMILSNRGGIFYDKRDDSEKWKQIPCDIPSNFVVVTIDGEVLPCYDDYYKKMSKGNIFEENLIDIWEKVEYVDFRRNLLKGERGWLKNLPCGTCNTIPNENNQHLRKLLNNINYNVFHNNNEIIEKSDVSANNKVLLKLMFNLLSSDNSLNIKRKIHNKLYAFGQLRKLFNVHKVENNNVFLFIEDSENKKFNKAILENIKDHKYQTKWELINLFKTKDLSFLNDFITGIEIFCEDLNSSCAISIFPEEERFESQKIANDTIRIFKNHQKKSLICIESGNNLVNECSNIFSINSDHKKNIEHLLSKLSLIINKLSPSKLNFILLPGPFDNDTSRIRFKEITKFLKCGIFFNTHRCYDCEDISKETCLKYKYTNLEFLFNPSKTTLITSPDFNTWDKDEYSTKLDNIINKESLLEGFHHCFICINDDVGFEVYQQLVKKELFSETNKKMFSIWGFDGTEEFINLIKSKKIIGGTCKVNLDSLIYSIKDIINNNIHNQNIPIDIITSYE
jgi:radical SAM protein with 4Fe4S-binding SPASM domain